MAWKDSSCPDSGVAVVSLKKKAGSACEKDHDILYYNPFVPERYCILNN